METYVRGSIQGSPVVAGKTGLESNDGRIVETNLCIRTGVRIRYRVRDGRIGITCPYCYCGDRASPRDGSPVYVGASILEWGIGGAWL